MPVPTPSLVADTLRSLIVAAVTTAGQVSRRRIVATIVALFGLVALVLMVELPTAVQLRDWATSAGPWLPLAFLGAHMVVTVLPFPRTAFTLAAGLLFGVAQGVVLAVLASTASAVIALVAVRLTGWRLGHLVRHRAVERLDARLRTRGWPAIMSLRLIPAVPFSILNYAAGASAVPVLPYTLATLVGLVPGTAAVVIFGDALTGRVSPVLFLVSLCTSLAGLGLLSAEIRHHRRHRHAPVVRREDAEPVLLR
ncbi:TVP38/TMEM64 family protein [Mycobacterium sp.]|uniref:TVP38/TMEM64 family protein n=1 Tax=Mycobacterium sp. TaxID=1785 RepID=UPI0026005852|nr:TVP38/TMEM64 family protein [Mycobacterium sp.]